MAAHTEDNEDSFHTRHHANATEHVGHTPGPFVPEICRGRGLAHVGTQQWHQSRVEAVSSYCFHISNSNAATLITKDSEQMCKSQR